MRHLDSCGLNLYILSHNSSNGGVVIILLWLLVGIVSVSLAFFLPANAVDPWEPLNTAGIVAGVYVFALALYSLRGPLSRKLRIGGWIVIIVVGGSILLAWRGYDDQSHYQAMTLSKIKNVISRGIIANELSEPLLKTLQAYHTQPTRSKKSLGTVFRGLHGGVAEGWDIHEKYAEYDRLSVIVTSLNDNEIILVAEDGLVKGENAEFKNRSGNKGMMQEWARLTERGISYEREN